MNSLPSFKGPAPSESTDPASRQQRREETVREQFVAIEGKSMYISNT
jgi:hypothetical protein